MANQDALHSWWWGNDGPRISGPLNIGKIVELLNKARKQGVVSGRKSSVISAAGWNYAVLKFLIEKCHLPNEVAAELSSCANPRSGNYAGWKQFLDENCTVKSHGKSEGINEENQNVELFWKRFYLFSEAVAYAAQYPIVYMQTTSTGLILRIGKASEGLGVCYNTGYQSTIDAAMWESGNSIYVAICDGVPPEPIEAELIKSIQPSLNIQNPTIKENVIIVHLNIIIESKRIANYSPFIA